MRIPTIHLNGTAPSVLLAKARLARKSIQEAITAVHEMAPHERDYYPQGEHAFGSAQDSHESVIMNLRKIEKELSDLIAGILRAGDRT